LADDHAFVMRNGRVLHGLQMGHPELRRWPTTYYGPQSGIGRLLAADREAPGRRIGIVGLGVGTLAAYGRPQDELRFYELDPNVLRLADQYFTFLKDCPGKVDVVLGDARASLEREPRQAFDVLVLDAFSSDAIPVHLLTREAFAVYLRHLKPQAAIAVHVSNEHLDLAPLLVGLAQEFGLGAERLITEGDGNSGITVADWVLLRHDAARRAMSTARSPRATHAIVWTDKYSNLLGLLK
jgi:hypothetical protein